jgi:hypothetical protein
MAVLFILVATLFSSVVWPLFDRQPRFIYLMTPTFHGNSSVMKLMFLRIGDGMGSVCVGHLLKASRDLTVCHWVIIHTVCLCGYYNG